MSLLGYLDFLTRDDPTQNLRPLLRHLLNTGRFHALRVPCQLAAGKAARIKKGSDHSIGN